MKIGPVLDRAQQRFPVLGFPVAVLYKFYDDQGNYLAATLTYYAFMAIFPLLLLASSIMGFILQGNEQLQEQLLNSALSQFPIIGDQLGRPEGLQGSTGAVIVGLIAALFGASGLGQALQNTLNAAWAVPRNSRPNPFVQRFKSLALLCMAGIAVLGVSILSTLVNSTEVFGGTPPVLVRILVLLATVALVSGVLTILSRYAAASHHQVGRSWPGAVAVAIAWLGLQHLGTLYVSKILVGASAMNATFALVLGLVGLIYIAAITGVFGIEINSVLGRKLWPRSLGTLFVDDVDLTEGDRRTYAGLVQTHTLKGFESVTVRFDGRDGSSYEYVLDKKSNYDPETIDGPVRRKDPDRQLIDDGTHERMLTNGHEPDSGELTLPLWVQPGHVQRKERARRQRRDKAAGAESAESADPLHGRSDEPSAPTPIDRRGSR